MTLSLNRNKVADALSRRDCTDHESQRTPNVASNTLDQIAKPTCVALTSPVPRWLDEIKASYTSSPTIKKNFQELQLNKLSHQWKVIERGTFLQGSYLFRFNIEIHSNHS